MWITDFHMTHEEIISQKNTAWLTLTGIQFSNGPWVSVMEISSSRGLEKP